MTQPLHPVSVRDAILGMSSAAGNLTKAAKIAGIDPSNLRRWRDGAHAPHPVLWARIVRKWAIYLRRNLATVKFGPVTGAMLRDLESVFSLERRPGGYRARFRAARALAPDWAKGVHEIALRD